MTESDSKEATDTDGSRIFNILNHLNDAWLASPNLRLTQLINILTVGFAPGVLSDADFLDRLLRWVEWDDACDEAGFDVPDCFAWMIGTEGANK